MKVLIACRTVTLGHNLARHLAEDRTLCEQPIGKFVLYDVVTAEEPLDAGLSVEIRPAISRRAVKRRTERTRTALTCSSIRRPYDGRATRNRKNFDKSYRINPDRTRSLFEAICQGGDQRQQIWTKCQELETLATRLQRVQNCCGLRDPSALVRCSKLPLGRTPAKWRETKKKLRITRKTRQKTVLEPWDGDC